jgi:hypothetical protein
VGEALFLQGTPQRAQAETDTETLLTGNCQLGKRPIGSGSDELLKLRELLGTKAGWSSALGLWGKVVFALPLLDETADRRLGDGESRGNLGLGHPFLMSGDDTLAKV